MNRYERAFHAILTSPAFNEVTKQAFGSDETAKMSFVGALYAKTIMMASSGLWKSESDEKLLELLRAWSHNYLCHHFRPEHAYGYGPISITTELNETNNDRRLIIRASLESIGDQIPAGGCLRIRTLSPIPPVETLADRDYATPRIQGSLDISYNGTFDDETTSSIAEVCFWGYDMAYSNGRLHTGVVKVCLVSPVSPDLTIRN